MSEFANLLGKIRGHNITRVFDDFLELSICAFSLGQMETQYLNIAKSYTAEDMQLFSQALGALIQEYESKSDNAGLWCDVLGTYFESINSASQAQRTGQFFTPETICDLMAKLTEGGATEGDVCDPSSGSGRNLIAHCRLKAQNRMNYFYLAADLDRRCVNMSVLNFIMYGMKGAVIHMDSLSFKIFGGYRVFLPETGLILKPLSIEECKKYVSMPEKTEHKEIKPPEYTLKQEHTAPEKVKQLAIF